MRNRVAQPVWAFLTVLLLASVTACSSGDDDPVEDAAPPAAAPADGPLSGSLVVFASEPLADPFKEMQADLAASNPKLSIVYTFAGTTTLAQQLEQKVPADVIASADQVSMQKLVAAKLIDTPAVFARDKLQIAVAKGNPKGITRLTDLTRSGVKVALPDAGTPAGRDARRAFENQLLTITPTSDPLDAKAALGAITSGKADATVLYVTDVAAAADSVTAVTIADRQNVVASFRIAVVKAAKNREAAKAYLDYVVNGPGQKFAKAHGFLGP